MKSIKRWNLPGLILLIFLAACSNEDTWKQREQLEITDYLKSVPDSVIDLKPSGLYYFEFKAGTGNFPGIDDTVYFKYIGRFLNGVAFDSVSTKSAPYKYIIGSMHIVTGVDEGLKYMKAGGNAVLLTPSDLAYGRQGVFNIIPGYTPLLWVIELDSIKFKAGR